MEQMLASSVRPAVRSRSLLSLAGRAARAVASQLRAEWLEVHRAYKAWADGVEDRTNPPRTIPLRETLYEPY